MAMSWMSIRTNFRSQRIFLFLRQGAKSRSKPIPHTAYLWSAMPSTTQLPSQMYIVSCKKELLQFVEFNNYSYVQRIDRAILDPVRPALPWVPCRPVSVDSTRDRRLV